MALPANFDTVRVYGTYLNLDGTPASGSVSFTANVPDGIFLKDAGADVLVLPMTLTVALDDQGTFSLKVPASDDPDVTPNGFTYTVREKFTNGSRTYTITVPTAGGAIDLVNAAPTTTVPQSVGLVTTDRIGAPNGVASLDGTGHVPTTQVPDLGGLYDAAGAATAVASTAAAALAAHSGNVANPHAVTKSQVGLSNVENPPTRTNVGTAIDSWVATMSSGQPYVAPTAGQAADITTGLRRLMAGRDASTVLTPLGFTITSGTEQGSGKNYSLALSEIPPGNRAWLGILVDRTAPPSIVVGCPHPVFDANSTIMGLDLWRLVPGAVLLIAGAHRDAGGGVADPRDNADTAFHQAALAMLTDLLPHVQMHGFADANAAGYDVVLSPGATSAGAAIARLSSMLTAAGIMVAQNWVAPISGLGGTTNIQGLAARDLGASFTHVECSATVRTGADTTKRSAVTAALAAGSILNAIAAVAPLANAVTGQYPLAVGSANTVGTSPYVARADHRHASRPEDLSRITAAEAPRLLVFSAPGPAAVTTGVLKAHADFGGRTMALTGLRASVSAAPTGAALTVVLRKNGDTGTTWASVSIADGAVTALTTPGTPPTLTAGDWVTVDITQVGSTTPGQNLTVGVALTPVVV